MTAVCAVRFADVSPTGAANVKMSRHAITKDTFYVRNYTRVTSDGTLGHAWTTSRIIRKYDTCADQAD